MERQTDNCSDSERAFFTRRDISGLTRQQRDGAYAEHRLRMRRYYDLLDETGGAGQTRRLGGSGEHS